MKTPKKPTNEEVKPQYFLIIAGFSNAHYTSTPVNTKEEASEQVFGFYSEEFKCFPLGETLPTDKKGNPISPKRYILNNGEKLLKLLKK